MHKYNLPFISEEILSNKLVEATPQIQKVDQIGIWTKGNAGMNALSRFLQESKVEKEDEEITDSFCPSTETSHAF